MNLKAENKKTASNISLKLSIMINSENFPKWETINSSQLDQNQEKKYDVIVVNTYFESKDISVPFPLSQTEQVNRIDPNLNLITKSCNYLKEGGLIFIYGPPRYLSYYSVHLDKINGDFNYLFKYWIALEFKSESLEQLTPSSHIGLVMHLKTTSIESPTPFELNTKTVRIPYRNCSACGLNVKDWGGKKHLLNQLGAAVSDVWAEIPVNISNSSRIPDYCLQRIHDLTNKSDSHMLLIVQDSLDQINYGEERIEKIQNQPKFSEDKVIHADSLKLMQNIAQENPNGAFDLVFADPPYNLAKNYSEYADAQSDKKYIEWCNSWLDLMYQILRPGGSLFVLNLPKWSRYHAEFLNKKMVLRNWIVWDALSSPAGKLMPAHYSLLYFTKPGGQITSNYEKLVSIDSREYCLRSSCLKKRKVIGNDRREQITDIWHDIHRIKHKKDRDTHPCQLPLKLMNRIVELTTNPGDWVYDPFGGAGTTAISARINKRHFIISDLDENYVRISERNLEKIIELPSGEKILERESIVRSKTGVSKKEIETSFISLCLKNKKVPTNEQLKELDSELLNKIEEFYCDYKKLAKIARRRLEIEGITPS